VTSRRGAALRMPAAGPGRWRLGTASRLLALHSVAVALVLVVVLLGVVRDFSAHYQRTLTADLAEEAPEYAQQASARPPGQSMEAFTRSYLQTHLLPKDHVLVVGLAHQPTLGSAGAGTLAASPVVAGWLAHPPPRSVQQTISLPAGSELALASPITAGGKIVGVLVSAASLERLTSETAQVTVIGGVEAALALLVAMTSAFLLLWRVLRAVAAVTDAAIEASQGDLGQRLGASADDEVGRLARAFDVMLARIADGVAAQRRLLSDVSHQLRTPLTVASGHLEVLRRSGTGDPGEVTETIDLVLDELSQTASLVDRLLLLGRALEPDFIDVERVDLRAFLGDVFEAARVLADRRWSLRPVPDAVILADQVKLRGALLNLIDNAVKATGPGEAIELSARCQDGLVLAVTDTGRGIPAEAQQDVFERFRRADGPAQPGAGLGLAIVRAVAAAHGGHARLDSSPGRGTTVTIVLPASCLEEPGVDPGGPG
jgi:signal transduction histidine kinase